jgi:hypothetical protein
MPTRRPATGAIRQQPCPGSDLRRSPKSTLERRTPGNRLDNSYRNGSAGGTGTFEATPLAVDGRLYFCGSGNDVVALAEHTGATALALTRTPIRLAYTHHITGRYRPNASVSWASAASDVPLQSGLSRSAARSPGGDQGPVKHPGLVWKARSSWPSGYRAARCRGGHSVSSVGRS